MKGPGGSFTAQQWAKIYGARHVLTDPLGELPALPAGLMSSAVRLYVCTRKHFEGSAPSEGQVMARLIPLSECPEDEQP